MKRAEVFQQRPGTWSVFIWGGNIPDRCGVRIAHREGWGRNPIITDIACTHAEALQAALKAVGLADPDPSRCPMRATDPITTRQPREDGWRCGYEAGHKHSHGLFTSDGEGVLYAGRWVHPAAVGLDRPAEHREAP